MANNRQIIVDEDTLVGFHFVKGKYYVTNKGYTTYRSTTDAILAVLQSLGITSITTDQLQALKDTFEVVDTIYYTWNNTGAYIKTLQFNEWEEYPLTIDCEKGKLYIMNTDIVYDLNVNESPTRVRIPYLCSYYKSKLGLSISLHDMTIYYNLLTSFYTPTVYVQFNINEETGTPTYSNTFILSNYDNSSLATYYGTYDALNKSTSSNIGNVSSIDSSTRIITATAPLTNLQAGDRIKVQGTITVVDGTNYTSDGTYTISSVSDTNIVVEESIPTSYQFPYYTCNLIVAQDTIEKIDSSTNTITLHQNVPDNINIGDTIYIQGTTYTEGYSTLTCNGTYTVQSKNNKDLVVSEQLPCDYSGSTGTIHAEMFLGNVSSIAEHSISILQQLPLTILQNSKVTVRKPNTTYTTYTISNDTSSGSNNIPITESAQTYTALLPTIDKLIQGTETLIHVTTSTLDNFPIGEFLLDTFTQAQNYIELSTGNLIQVPTNNILNSILNVSVSNTYNIEETDTGITTMTCKGIYSKVYEEK